MSRKDYEAIAAVLARQADAQARHQTSALERLHYVALDLCDVFERDNPRFDPARFMRATKTAR